MPPITDNNIDELIRTGSVTVQNDTIRENEEEPRWEDLRERAIAYPNPPNRNPERQPITNYQREYEREYIGLDVAEVKEEKQNYTTRAVTHIILPKYTNIKKELKYINKQLSILKTQNKNATIKFDIYQIEAEETIKIQMIIQTINTEPNHYKQIKPIEKSFYIITEKLRQEYVKTIH